MGQGAVDEAERHEPGGAERRSRRRRAVRRGSDAEAPEPERERAQDQERRERRSGASEQALDETPRLLEAEQALHQVGVGGEELNRVEAQVATS